MNSPSSELRRLHLHTQENGTFRLSAEGRSWFMEFPDIEAALDHTRVFSAGGRVRLTVYDQAGRPIIETFA